VILNSNQSLQVLIGSAPTTAQPQFSASWSDQALTYQAGAFAYNQRTGSLTGTAAVTLVPAPAANTSRSVQEVSLYNADTVSQVFTLQVIDTATTIVLGKFTIPAGQTLRYGGESGYQFPEAVTVSGTVTSVGLTAPGIFSVSGSPVTSSGTLALSLATQAANLVWAGPSTGAAAAPAFRSLVVADIPTGLPYAPSSAITTLLGSNNTWTGTNTFSSTLTGTLTGNASTATKWATARTLSFTGDATGSGSVDGSANVATALSLATVNANVGSFGSASQVATFTVNAKGLTTAAGNVTITPAAIGALALAGGTLTGALTVTAAASGTAYAGYLALKPSDYGTNKSQLIFENGGSPNAWAIGAFDGTSNSGTLQLAVSAFGVTGPTTITGALTVTAQAILKAVTVASLPTPSSALAGARSSVTDSTTITFFQIAAGGGSAFAPVFCDGANWRIG
jgi:hypothetical protein